MWFEGAVLGLLCEEEAVNLDIGNPGAVHCQNLGALWPMLLRRSYHLLSLPLCWFESQSQ